jgi:hypothetical protein
MLDDANDAPVVLQLTDSESVAWICSQMWFCWNFSMYIKLYNCELLADYCNVVRQMCGQNNNFTVVSLCYYIYS